MVHKRATSILLSLILCLCAPEWILTTAASPSSTQKSHRTHHVASRKPKQGPVEQPCGSDATLKLSTPESTQGSLLLIELRGTKPLTQIKGAWNDKEIPFWQQDRRDQTTSGQAAPDTWLALLGVDLELKAGDHQLSITGQTAEAGPLACTATIAVEEGKFATERLRVAPNFVEPNPEQLARAEAERERLRAIFATITPDRLWQGPFRVPLAGVTTGGNFGKRRVLNGTPGSPHSGVDFPAPSGTPVYAPQRGRVVLAEPLYFSGNTVILDHGLGLYTFYGHLESIDAKAGEIVDTGALLGKVGATGRVTGPHLHWGLTLNRARVSPLQLVDLSKTGDL